MIVCNTKTRLTHKMSQIGPETGWVYRFGPAAGAANTHAIQQAVNGSIKMLSDRLCEELR